ncbi:MAG: hypothetical protein ACPL1Y_01000 [Thermoplasmata archaeon]
MSALLLANLFLLLASGTANFSATNTNFSTTYSFRVESEIATCEIEPDGSAWISYRITFHNYATIDYIDIGMPNKYYDLTTAKATIFPGNFSPIEVSGIKKSSVISCGYEIPVPAMYQQSEYLMVETVCKVTRMVYKDTENESYGSVEFYPTYWGSFCLGLEELQTTIIFPPAVQDPNSTKWHHSQPDWMRFESGRIKFTWNSSGNYEHKYGVSFPKTAVTNIYEPDKPNFWDDFWNAINNGFVCWFNPYVCCNPAILFLIIAPLMLIISWRTKMSYLPPDVGVEGMGIKYGLTAPEAAVLLNVPLNKLVTLVYFGLYRKGVISVESKSPLRLKVLREDYEGLHSYELGFRAAINPDGSLNEEILKSATIQLIKEVDGKLRGFSRKETANYYKKIIERAWEQVRSANMEDLKLQALEENFEWMYLDKKFDRELQNNFRVGFYRVPIWYSFFYPRYSAPARTIDTSGLLGTPKLPMLPGSEFANQFVSGIQQSANQFVRNLTGFTRSVTAATNPVAVSQGGYRGGGFGGGGCACACACAGCACACAGGGR